MASVAILIVLLDIILSSTAPAFALLTESKPAIRRVPSKGFNSFILKSSFIFIFIVFNQLGSETRFAPVVRAHYTRILTTDDSMGMIK